MKPYRRSIQQEQRKRHRRIGPGALILVTVLTFAATPAFAAPPVGNPGGPYTETAGVAFNFDGSLSSDPDVASKERSQLSFNNSIVTCNDNVWTFSR